MTKSEILKSIAAMSPEMQAELLIGVGRILEPNAERIGAWFIDHQENIEPLHNFLTHMHIAYDRGFNGAYDVDVLDESISGVLVGVSFNNGIVAAWTTEGCKLPDWVMPQVEQKYYEANSFKKVKVA